jgi:hypothetical protein
MNNIVEKQKVISIQNFLRYTFGIVPIAAYRLIELISDCK